MSTNGLPFGLAEQPFDLNHGRFFIFHKWVVIGGDPAAVAYLPLLKGSKG
jgi:hypothetical protein